jgi:hypothetical protein
MSHFTNALDAYRTTSSLANAKRVVKHLTKRPSYLDIATETDAALIREAQRTVDDAKDPAKIREAMQQELRARFKGMNITVI